MSVSVTTMPPPVVVALFDAATATTDSRTLRRLASACGTRTTLRAWALAAADEEEREVEAAERAVAATAPGAEVLVGVGARAARVVRRMGERSAVAAHVRWRSAVVLPRDGDGADDEVVRVVPRLALALATRHIFVFDFDGVVCDSAEETGMSAFLASKGLVSGADGVAMPPPELVRKFCAARPLLETGYEAIVILFRLVDLEEDPADMLRDPDVARSTQEAMRRMPGSPSVDELKKRFQAARDAWIHRDEDSWFRANGFYEPVVRAMRELLANDQAVYVCTTKHASFAHRLLKRVGVDLPPSHLFGLGSPRKPVVIGQIATSAEEASRGPATICFVEDRVETLVEASRSPTSMRMFLAGFGYNTSAQRNVAAGLGIPVLASAEDLRCAFLELAGTGCAPSSSL